MDSITEMGFSRSGSGHSSGNKLFSAFSFSSSSSQIGNEQINNEHYKFSTPTRTIFLAEEDDFVDESLALNCNYENNVTYLYHMIEKKVWISVYDFLSYSIRSQFYYGDGGSPKTQARTWVSKFSEEDDMGNSKVLKCQLPLHLAIKKNAPFKVISKLIRLYPESIKLRDDQLYLPIHLAFQQHGRDNSDYDNGGNIIYLLMKLYPESMNIPGGKGKIKLLPHECCWRSSKVIQERDGDDSHTSSKLGEILRMYISHQASSIHRDNNDENRNIVPSAGSKQTNDTSDIGINDTNGHALSEKNEKETLSSNQNCINQIPSSDNLNQILSSDSTVQMSSSNHSKTRRLLKQSNNKKNNKYNHKKKEKNSNNSHIVYVFEERFTSSMNNNDHCDADNSVRAQTTIECVDEEEEEELVPLGTVPIPMNVSKPKIPNNLVVDTTMVDNIKPLLDSRSRTSSISSFTRTSSSADEGGSIKLLCTLKMNRSKKDLNQNEGRRDDLIGLEIDGTQEEEAKERRRDDILSEIYNEDVRSTKSPCTKIKAISCMLKRVKCSSSSSCKKELSTVDEEELFVL